MAENNNDANKGGRVPDLVVGGENQRQQPLQPEFRTPTSVLQVPGGRGAGKTRHAMFSPPPAVHPRRRAKEKQPRPLPDAGKGALEEVRRALSFADDGDQKGIDHRPLLFQDSQPRLHDGDEHGDAALAGPEPAAVGRPAVVRRGASATEPINVRYEPYAPQRRSPAAGTHSPPPPRHEERGAVYHIHLHLNVFLKP